MKDNDGKAALAACLCFLNFLPLWGIVVFTDVASLYKQGWGWQGCGAEWCTLGGIFLGLLVSVTKVEGWIRKISKDGLPNGEEFRLRRIEEKKTLTVEVLLTYVLPLFAFQVTEWQELAEFLVFFAVVVWLAANHRVMSGSLYLELRNYHYYEITMSKVGEEATSHRLVLSKTRL